MEMTFNTAESGVMTIVLKGRMDIQGAMQIDLQFAAVTAAHKAVVVDMAEVTFLASMGLRTLIMGAKSMHSKFGRMVLLGPPPDVENVLVTSGTDTLIPIVHSLPDAERHVLG
jgi:anti-anti-sigma factor